MRKYNFLQPYLWFKLQDYFLKPLILLSVILTFSLLQIATTITTEILVQLDYLRITQLLATDYD